MVLAKERGLRIISANRPSQSCDGRQHDHAACQCHPSFGWPMLTRGEDATGTTHVLYMCLDGADSGGCSRHLVQDKRNPSTRTQHGRLTDHPTLTALPHRVHMLGQQMPKSWQSSADYASQWQLHMVLVLSLTYLLSIQSQVQLEHDIIFSDEGSKFCHRIGEGRRPWSLRRENRRLGDPVCTMHQGIDDPGSQSHGSRVNIGPIHCCAVCRAVISAQARKRRLPHAKVAWVRYDCTTASRHSVSITAVRGRRVAEVIRYALNIKGKVIS